jgi:predicted glycoside hydrolase/deacetylase ChbG (UPF0249 family)
MCHSVNKAVAMAFELGAISSASLMVPCPQYADAIATSRQNPLWDAGIHLTLTSEWPVYKWLPLSSRKDRDSSQFGLDFFPEHTQEISQCKESWVWELETQITQAKHDGVSLSHMDSHMFALFTSERLSSYLELAHRHNLLPLVTKRQNGHLTHQELSTGMQPIIDDLWYATPDVPPQAWLEYHVDLLRKLEPGINQLLVHPGFADYELLHITAGIPEWGAEWRQRDFDVISGRVFASELKRNNIKLISWREAAAIHSETGRLSA